MTSLEYLYNSLRKLIIDSAAVDSTFAFSVFVSNLIITGLLTYIMSVMYVRYGTAISNRKQLGNVLVLIGITTFLVVSTVKSSLALSLGLVGALSIIRFRTAIKEPEELAYFFIVIAIGVGLGANQLLTTCIGFIVLLIVVISLNRNKIKRNLVQNIVISMPYDQNQTKTQISSQIIEIVTANTLQMALKRANYGQNDLHLNFLVRVKNIEHIQTISAKLLAFNDNLTVTFINNFVQES